MSASPAGPPAGPSSTTPNATGAAPARRRKAPGGPFMNKSKPVRKPTAPKTNGTNGAGKPIVSHPSAAKQAADPDDDPSTYTAFPLVATGKAQLEKLRFHAMRFAGKGEIGVVNPWDSTQFIPPLRLHRRFARDTLNVPVVPTDGLDDKESEKEVIKRAERQAQKEADQALIAPNQKSEQTKKRQQVGQKKVVDVFYPQDTVAAQKTAKLRYEEGRPWHLEDFDSKNTWIGSYEEPLSETHVMLSLGEDGSFRMVPLEKWYKFIPTGRVKTMSLDEAEKHMAKKIKDSRWLADAQQGITLKQRMDAERQKNHSRGRVGMRGEQTRFKGEDDDAERLDIANDMDEIDFEHEDEFQDDDEAEGKLYGEEDEEFKESKRKIREEQLGANVFAGSGVKEEKDWDEEEEREKKEAKEERRRQRKLKKSLVKQERKYEYESESDHPYSEDSDSEDSETERQKEEEKKKEEEEKNKANGDKAPSVTSTGTTNTPSGRVEKHQDSRNHLSAASLKRPGSPNLSEASGSESTRKRIKKDPSGPISRPMSPSNVHGARSPNAIRAGSGSDTEASGTEKGRTKSKNAASRLGSQKVGSPVGSAPPSRPGSPPLPSASASIPGMPTADQVRAAIPTGGITIAGLIGRFRSSIPKSKEANTAFITLVKRVGKNSPEDKSLIVLK